LEKYQAARPPKRRNLRQKRFSVLLLFLAFLRLGENFGQAGENKALPEDFCGPVRAMAFSPDSSLLAVGGEGLGVALWRVADGQLVGYFAAKEWGFGALAFSPEGRFLAAGSRQGKVRVFRLADGFLQESLHGHEDQILALAFSPDGSLLASASLDTTVRLWWVAGGRLFRVLRGHSLWPKALAFSPDGTLLASGDVAGQVKLWRVAEGEAVGTLAGKGLGVDGLAFSPQGRLLAVATFDSLALWRLPERQLLRRFAKPEPKSEEVAVRPAPGFGNFFMVPFAGKKMHSPAPERPTPSPLPSPLPKEKPAQADAGRERGGEPTVEAPCPFQRVVFTAENSVFVMGASGICTLDILSGQVLQSAQLDASEVVASPNGLWLAIALEKPEENIVEILVLDRKTLLPLRILYRCRPTLLPGEGC
jgi:WD40 repeat protein